MSSPPLQIDPRSFVAGVILGLLLGGGAVTISDVRLVAEDSTDAAPANLEPATE